MREVKRQTHPEAFMLMRYRDEVTGAVELIWNSRDGVTPFQVTSPAGNPSVHVNWEADQWRPDYIPALGSRMFVDVSGDQEPGWIQMAVEKHQAAVQRDLKMSEAEARAHLTDVFRRQWEEAVATHAPTVVMVTEEIRAVFLARAAITGSGTNGRED